MSELSNFLQSSSWPANQTDLIQLYGFPSPNSAKIAVALEELGLEYELQFVPFGPDGVGSPEFKRLSPNGKMPALIDPNGSDGPVGIFESGAILLYLAEKHGRLLPTDTAGRFRVIQWLMWQMAGLGPMIGQIGYFHRFAGNAIDDPRPKARYVDETRRLLHVLEAALEGQDWIAGEYSIADIAIAPWLRSIEFYEARELVGWPEFKVATDYYDRFFSRPAVQRADKRLSSMTP